MAAHRLARSLAALTYARRFVNEALTHYREAARLAPTPGAAAADLRHAADCALAIAGSGQAYELQLAAADRAEAAGDREVRAIALARAVVVARRHAGFGFESVPPPETLRALAEEAATTAGLSAGPSRPHEPGPHEPGPHEPGTDVFAQAGGLVVAAHVAAAEAWLAGEAATSDPALAQAALAAARRTGDPVLIGGALDCVLSAAARAGDPRTAYRLSWERLDLLPVMDHDDPRAGIEIVDSLHTAAAYAIAVGDLPEALALAWRATRDDFTGNHPALARSKLIPPLALTGDFDAAVRHAEEMWESQARMDRPPGRWMTAALCAVALVHGLRGNAERFASWRARAAAVGDLVGSPQHRPLGVFVDARLAVHAGRFETAAELCEQAAAGFRPGFFDRYATAACAELAVVAGLPDAAGLLTAAEPAGRENDWAAACLARAAGRLTGDAAALEASVAGWERIGARFERACTLWLLPARRDEAVAELAALGATHPGDH
ncbi:hypothetical protein HII36_42265 [Nonomuraea sp. NN258]|nr:hypothetical protein [Nonomuraea antri]